MKISRKPLGDESRRGVETKKKCFTSGFDGGGLVNGKHNDRIIYFDVFLSSNGKELLINKQEGSAKTKHD